MIRAVLLVLVAACAMSADGALPANVTRDVNEYRTRVEKITQDANKKKSDETAKIAKVLDDYIKSETKKGNLDGAIAIRNLRDDLVSDTTPSGDDLLGDRIDTPAGSETLIIGFWKMDNGTTWEVKPGGVLTRTHADGTLSECTWKRADGKIQFVYENGRAFPLIRVDRKQLVVFKNGGEFVGQRDVR
jgi:hypothetical protein